MLNKKSKSSLNKPFLLGDKNSENVNIFNTLSYIGGVGV